LSVNHWPSGNNSNRNNEQTPNWVSPDWNPNAENPSWNETFFEIGSTLPLKYRTKRNVITFPKIENNSVHQESIDLNGSDGDINTEVDLIGNATEILTARSLPQLFQSVSKIDVGPQSQLFVAPGSTSIIYFEITNLRNEPTYHVFNVQDEKRFLRQMEPRLYV
jgi:hypothetical protein